MELTLDIFKNDAFSVTTLQRVVKNVPYVPTMLGQMGLFEPKPILTKEVLLYEEDGNVRIIPVTERGAPDIQQIRDTGRLRALATSRLSKKDTVRAGELFAVANAAMPESIRLRSAVQLVNDRTANLRTDMEATKELHRFGGLQGKLVTTREDGSTYTINFFTEYGIAEPAAVSINFGTTAEADLMMDFQEDFLQPMMLSLKNRGTMQTRLGAITGPGFWSKLMRHPAVRHFYELQQAGAGLALGSAGTVTGSNLWGHVYFAGIDWYHFRGMTGGEIEVPTNDAIMFPIGAKDVFNVYWAPGETLFDVTNPGQPEYLYVQPDMRNAMPEYVDIVLRAYPLYACIYPQCLMRATAV